MWPGISTADAGIWGENFPLIYSGIIFLTAEPVYAKHEPNINNFPLQLILYLNEIKYHV